MALSPILFLLVIGGGPPSSDVAEDRAKRAAIVDRVMGEPTRPDFKPVRSMIFERVEDDPGRGGEDDPIPQDVEPPLDRRNLDYWVFGNRLDDRLRREWLDYLLWSRLALVADRGDLTAAQLDKLKLAGRGDIKRFFDAVEEMRPGFEAVRSDAERGHQFLAVSLKPLCLEFENGPFGEDSLLAKTLRKMLGDRESPRGRARIPGEKDVGRPRKS